jgi:hypothetical protein
MASATRTEFGPVGALARLTRAMSLCAPSTR